MNTALIVVGIALLFTMSSWIFVITNIREFKKTQNELSEVKKDLVNADEKLERRLWELKNPPLFKLNELIGNRFKICEIHFNQDDSYYLSYFYNYTICDLKAEGDKISLISVDEDWLVKKQKEINKEK